MTRISIFFPVVILLVLISLQSSGQVTFGIRGGLNLAMIHSKDDFGTYNDNKRIDPGFHFGVQINKEITPYMEIELGVFANTKGFKYWQLVSGSTEVLIARLYYLDFPVLIKPTYEFKEGFRMYAEVGPSVGVGLKGKTILKYDNVRETRDISWHRTTGLRRLDFALVFGAGVDIDPVSIGILYDFGIANISSYIKNGYKDRNRVLRVSVMYRFLKRKGE